MMDPNEAMTILSQERQGEAYDVVKADLEYKQTEIDSLRQELCKMESSKHNNMTVGDYYTFSRMMKEISELYTKDRYDYSYRHQDRDIDLVIKTREVADRMVENIRRSIDNYGIQLKGLSNYNVSVISGARKIVKELHKVQEDSNNNYVKTAKMNRKITAYNKHIASKPILSRLFGFKKIVKGVDE